MKSEFINERISEMNRTKKLALNTISSLIKQAVSIICAFILPRLFLIHYGSDINGLVSSITQFLGLVSIFDAGMGVVIEASLYKPLSENDKNGISRVMTSGQRFYRRFVVILFVYVIIIALGYPLIVKEQFDYIFTLTLVLAISISSFGQYAIGVTNSVLLSADQRSYINFWAYTVTTIINTAFGAILIYFNCSVQVVKLVSSLVFLVRPVFLAVYVKRHYSVNWHEKYSEEPIKQKWNGFAQHIAALVVGNTDIVVLTAFSSLENVSIYSVYFLVINSIKEIINAGTSGIKSLLGDMIARGENKNLDETFGYMEWFLHTVITLLFSVTAVTIVPFVSVYTLGVNDADYNVPVFAILLSVAYAIYCLRMPYFNVIQAAGHFRQTQLSAIIEAIINVVVSVIVVFRFGLIGVACGTIAAMLYRVVYLVWYLKRNILYRPLKFFVKNLFVDVISFAIIILSTRTFAFEHISYPAWCGYAIKICVVGFFEVLVINIIFYKEQVMKIIQTAYRKLNKKKR